MKRAWIVWVALTFGLSCIGSYLLKSTQLDPYNVSPATVALWHWNP